MTQKKQNPGVQAGASRNQLGGWLQIPLTVSESQAQMLAARYYLKPAMARETARLFFGESLDD